MSKRLAIAALTAFAAAAPLAAEPVVVSAPAAIRSFHNLESEYDGDELVDQARARLNAAIPAGTPMTDARLTLKHAGARCQRGQASLVRCQATSFQLISDSPLEVVWTINVTQQDDRVTGMTVDRESYGS